MSRCVVAGMLSVCLSFPLNIAASGSSDPDLARLGASIFHDVNFSRNRSQACSSCHDPARAFTDGRNSDVAAAVSLGDDRVSLGDRNTPTISYASLTPEFHRDPEGNYIGGLFHDGRAISMATQAMEPITNPIEMALAGPVEVRNRVLENPSYLSSLQRIFGEKISRDPEETHAAIGKSLAHFESSEHFSPFDSRYDRYLRGQYKMTRMEELGRKIFFSDLINCRSCHLVNLSPKHKRETFTNYQYHNIGVPANSLVRAKNGKAPGFVDQGLLENPLVDDVGQRGKFKVPTLRNIAVTGPYMHNGVFRELKTVLQFYNKYLVDNAGSRTNPETGAEWKEPEVNQNISMDLLTNGQPLDSNFILALEAFLKTLTDRRYEDLVYKSH